MKKIKMITGYGQSEVDESDNQIGTEDLINKWLQENPSINIISHTTVVLKNCYFCNTFIFEEPEIK